MHELKPMWNSKDIRKQSKSKVCESLLLSVSLYGNMDSECDISANTKVICMGSLRKIEALIKRNRPMNSHSRKIG